MTTMCALTTFRKLGATCPECGARLYRDDAAEQERLTFRADSKAVESDLGPAIVIACSGCEFAIEEAR